MMRGVAAGNRAGVGRRIAMATLSAALVAGVLSACDSATPGPTEPPVSPTPTVAVSPDPTPSETPLAEPTKPPEMARSDELGAVAAAEYFMALFNYVLATGDLTEWNQASDPDCRFCSNVRDDVGPVYASGGRYDGGVVALSDAKVIGFDETLRVHAVQLAFVGAPGAVVDSAGNTTDTVDAASGYLVLDVGYTNNGWRLVTGGVHDQPVAP